MVPHRAQKALLQARLPSLAGAVDTVERFQGGERDLIIVSATISDLAYAQSESDFLLEPRRLTVAVSRPKQTCGQILVPAPHPAQFGVGAATEQRGTHHSD